MSICRDSFLHFVFYLFILYFSCYLIFLQTSCWLLILPLLIIRTVTTHIQKHNVSQPLSVPIQMKLPQQIHSVDSTECQGTLSASFSNQLLNQFLFVASLLSILIRFWLCNGNRTIPGTFEKVPHKIHARSVHTSLGILWVHIFCFCFCFFVRLCIRVYLLTICMNDARIMLYNFDTGFI